MAEQEHLSAPPGWNPEDTNRVYLEVERGLPAEESRYQGAYADQVRAEAAQYLADQRAKGQVSWPVNE